MIPVEQAIHRLRRDLTLAMTVKLALLVTAGACLVWGHIARSQEHAFWMLAGLAALWIALSYKSAQGTRLTAHSSNLIAAGEYEQAEQSLDAAMRSFSMSRTSKLVTLHHLAVLRHAQKRWDDSARLCGALLRHRLGPVAGLSRSSRLMMAECMLEMGDAAGAYRAIAGLYDQRLMLGEALKLLELELDYAARIGAWGYMMEAVWKKVQLIELMGQPRAAMAQALLALAARKLGRPDWSSWLKRRVELLVGDVKELTAQRPMIAELWN